MPERKRARTLATVLFTDIVDSTHLAGELGDRRWRELMARHHHLIRHELKRFHGREIDTAGDGFFATFHEPEEGLRCAVAVSDAVRSLGVEIRAGVHVGECEQMDGKLGGMAVHVGSRVMSNAGPGEVMVSSTTRELVVGSSIDFADRGTRELKGVPGEWHLLSVSAVDGARRPPPLEAEVATRLRACIEPTPLLRRRLPLLIGGAVALAVVAVGAMVLLPRGGPGGPRALTLIPANSVVRIDPATGTAVQALTAGSEPTAVAVDRGKVWVLRMGPGIVVRLDPRSGEPESTSTGGNPTSVAVAGDGTVWVLNGLAHTLVAVDPVEVEMLGAPIDPPTGTKDLAWGEGALWVTNEIRGQVYRVDPVTGTYTTIPLGSDAQPGGIAVCGGAVWVIVGDQVWKLDPAGVREPRQFALLDTAEKIAYWAGAVWVTHLGWDEVSRVDAATGHPVPIAVGNGPAGVAVGYGAVWVTDSLDGTVARIDPHTNRVTVIHVGNSPEGIAVGAGGVWVAVHPL